MWCMRKAGYGCSALHRGINQVADQHAEILALARRLDHQQRPQLLDRVDPELGAGAAAPEVLADRARIVRHAGLLAHGEAEAEAVARRNEIRLDLHIGPEVVMRHQFERLPADDALAIERPAT